MKKIILISTAMIFVGALYSCVNMDLYPTNEFLEQQVIDDADGLELTTNGMYRWFHTARSDGGAPGGRFIRDWHHTFELRGDALFIAGVTEDPMMLSYTYRESDRDRPARNMWFMCYTFIEMANKNLSWWNEGTSLKQDHILGENYFLRALSYFFLCDLFAWPYTNTNGGPNAPGVVLRTENTVDDGNVTRATLGEIYAQIEKDAKKAYELMNKNYRRSTNNGYASKESARALLARLYLYMGRNQECVNLVDEMLGGATATSKLDPNIGTYPTRVQTSQETLWCVGIRATESLANSSIASMMLTDPVSSRGWGEIYTSDPLLELFQRHPEDIRWGGSTTSRGPATGIHYFPPPRQTITYNGTPVNEMIHWPVEVPSVDYWGLTSRCVGEDTGGKFIIFENDPNLSPNSPNADEVFGSSARIYIQEEIENTYKRYYFMFNGQKYRVTLTPVVDNRMSYRKIFNYKFSGQDGDNMLCSVPLLRWGEVILNRAEAYAKLGNVDAALADVNAIRSRAGLSGDALMTTENMGPRGYSDILDLVLDERRLELAYEALRWTDLYRNNKPMDRRYGGTHKWEVIQPNDPRILFPIPWEEINANPGVTQNLR